MKAVLGRRLLAVHGTVHSIGHTVPLECVLQRPTGGLITFALPANVPPVRRGEAISVIFFGRPTAGAVLGVVNHTVLDGENYLRLTARQRPDAWDAVSLSAGFVGVVSALGADGLVPFALLVAAYGLLVGVIPMALRERLARRVDGLIDQQARSHRAAAAHPNDSTPPSCSGEEGP